MLDTITVPPGGASLQGAMDSGASCIHLLAGTYEAAEIVVPRLAHIEGAGPRLTRLIIPPGAHFGLRYDRSELRYLRLSGLSIETPDRFTGAAIQFPYGVQMGRLRDLEIVGSGSGTGIRLCGANLYTGGPNTNQYFTKITGCLFYRLALGIYLSGKIDPGCLPNANLIKGCTFENNDLHVSIEQGEMNVLDWNNFNPVNSPVGVRVRIVGRYSTTILRDNYWDMIGQQLCVQQTGFGEDITRRGRAALLIDGDNQPASKFVSDGRVDYRGIWSMAPGKE